MEHLDPSCGWNSDVDPTANGLWDVADDWERGYCRNCIEWLLAHTDLVMVALERSANGDVIHQRVSPSE
jgi:hypothetical protein